MFREKLRIRLMFFEKILRNWPKRPVRIVVWVEGEIREYEVVSRHSKRVVSILHNIFYIHPFLLSIAFSVYPSPALPWRLPHFLSKELAKIAGVWEAAPLPHLGRRPVCGQQQVAGLLQAVSRQKFHRRDAQHLPEAVKTGIAADVSRRCDLRQRTVRQRVENLIAIAHPDFRAELRREASRLMYY